MKIRLQKSEITNRASYLCPYTEYAVYNALRGGEFENDEPYFIRVSMHHSDAARISANNYGLRLVLQEKKK